LFFKREKILWARSWISNGYLRRKKALASSCNCHFLPLEQNKNKEEEEEEEEENVNCMMTQVPSSS
jgi:hypothetical protein